MNCPRCNNALHSKLYENISIDNCHDCGGIWLDAGELQPILETRDVIFSPAMIEKSLKESRASIPQVEQDTSLPCPKCKSRMHSLNYNYSSGVILNACPHGHGLWFDKEELVGVQIYMEHWDDAKNQEKWKNLHAQSSANEIEKLNTLENNEWKKSGPIGKAIDTLLDLLSGSTTKG